MTATLMKLPLQSIDGETLTLERYLGKVLLVVNVASKCGLTSQYEGLERLYEAQRELGLEVLGFPANNFKQQEPGSDAEIKEFCTLTYGVQFPMFAKLSVVGEDKHPLYDELTRAQPEATGDGPFRERMVSRGGNPNPKLEVLWNFEKFLIGRNGEVVGRFAPDVTADDPRLVEAIEVELAKG
ncbi:MAG: glutathione peroxidase [Pseudomonas sp. PGPPP4]|uniref:glutathione peroxidase n=1 Tax=Pseudomonas sp. PGPPP4 TaxID=2015556 RepID=UPI000BCFB968|nr:glutathione peroxidase [Pseudomonas sp. PGPPP4]OYT78720.1 MAG: glutathione peroxidase [Pseudomonas sp. PGPPP4]